MGESADWPPLRCPTQKPQAPSTTTIMNSIQRNRTENNSGGRRLVDWSALRQDLPGQYGTPRGSCEGCRLYLWSDGALRVPGLRGLFCRVSCLECTLFGPGRCRWCAASLGSTAKKFCDGHCRKQSDRTQFGGGDRLLNFLSHQYPALYEQLIGRRGHTCLNCGISLEGKRSDSKFCSHQCQLEFRRRTMSGKLRKSGDSRLSDSAESTSYTLPEIEPVQGVKRHPESKNWPR